MKELFTINTPQPVQAEEIDNVLVAAFEGGITYWCHKAEVKDNDYKGGKYASNCVSKGGTVLLHYEDEEGKDKKAVLDLESIKRGIPLLLAKFGKTWTEWYDNHDAGDADCLVQFAVFGELVYG